MVERPIGRAVVIVCVLRVAFRRRRHLGMGGCLDFCHRLGTVRSKLGTGCSPVGASRVILTIIDDVVQICHVLVVGASVLMKHCKSVKSILRVLHLSCVLQKEFNQADVV